ncbi:uncharacterized protein LAESUDRAFT_740269 [Laetiporus sulphureus 93-53]|uniref:Long chronological lifespan protein 2 n=1 Tax=Laetiporus sulphureus 93-53 TaxID=1314785 RepID=A0A165IGI6_9APHY|nr:uncharacterized protein LAESUDRAFT_740269 [Laetiporus sulphureus 93-53]KZT13042.1 hypothetical protein LAESUDRAFT_740269 [Laetiporus sulphureus 93-53]
MLPNASFLYALFLLIPSVCSQFNFFEHMFGHPGHQQQQQRQTGASGAGQWVARSDSVSCSQYLCPDTLVCVPNPSECPCPDVQDIKCLIPDSEDKESSTVLCVRGPNECAEVERLSRKLA